MKSTVWSRWNSILRRVQRAGLGLQECQSGGFPLSDKQHIIYMTIINICYALSANYGPSFT